MNDKKDTQAGNLRGGWSPVYHEAWTHYLPVIGKDALLYYLFLVDRRNTDDADPRFGKSWTGRNNVASWLGIAKKTLIRIDDVLVAAKLVDIERIPTQNGKPRIQYTVHDPLPVNEIKMDELRKRVEEALKPYEEKKQKEREQRNGNENDHVGAMETEDGFDGNMINNYVSRTNDKELSKHDDASDKSFASYNSRDIINYFCAKYLERYKKPYVPSYGREGKQIKDKLLASMSPERVIKLIDVVIDRYSSEWASPKYERPTIGALCGWLANKAVVYIVDDAAERAEETQQAPVYDYEAIRRQEGW